MSRIFLCNKPEWEDQPWLNGLKLDDEYQKIYCKFYDEAQTLVLGAAVISIPYPNFARVDGLYAINPESLNEFFQVLTTTYKQDIISRLTRETIKTVNPRLSIKNQPGFNIVEKYGYKLYNEGLFGDTGEWYVYSVWEDHK